MDVFRPQATLERSNIDRPSVEIERDVANRRAKAVSHDGNSKSFFEVAAAGRNQSATGCKGSIRPKPSTAQRRPLNYGKIPRWVSEIWSISSIPCNICPIAATIYRNRTGDGIGFAPRVIGGALWGRVGGFVSGIVNVLVDSLTGKDIGDHIYSALFGASGNSRGSSDQNNGSGLTASASQESRDHGSAAFRCIRDDGVGFRRFRRRWWFLCDRQKCEARRIIGVAINLVCFF